MHYLIIAIALLLGIKSCENDKKQINAIKPPTVRPSQRSVDATILYSDSGSLKAVLKTKEMLAYEKNMDAPFVLMNKGLKLVFYNKEQKPTSTLTADQGVYFTKSGKAYVKYNVKVANNKHETLYTENLYWDQKKEKIIADKNVKIVTPTQIIMGTGLESDQDFSEYTIKNISGIIQLDSTSKK